MYGRRGGGWGGGRRGGFGGGWGRGGWGGGWGGRQGLGFGGGFGRGWGGGWRIRPAFGLGFRRPYYGFGNGCGCCGIFVLAFDLLFTGALVFGASRLFV